jgi:AcrR family transcriptional regulator
MARTSKRPSTPSNPLKKGKGSYRHGDLRNALLVEALRLIQERRQVDFNLRELAEGTGVSHTAAYRHFGSKRELLAEIALGGYQRLLFLFQEVALASRPRPVRAGSKAVKDSVPVAQWKTYVRFALENPGRFRAMVNPELQPFVDFPELYSTAKALFQCTVTEIRKEIESGRYRKDSPSRMALAAWSSFHGLSQLILDQLVVDSMDPIPLDLEATLSYFGETVERGFLKLES